MAITFTTSHIDNAVGIAVTGVYCRVANYTHNSMDASGPFTRDGSGNETDTRDTNHANYRAAHTTISYEVILHRSASIRNGVREELEYWPNRIRCIHIDRFKFDVTLADLEVDGTNAYKLIYDNLKSQIELIKVDGEFIVSNIEDA